MLSDQMRNDFAASFQNIACQTLVDKLVMATEEFSPKSVVIAGGVAANQELRRQLAERLPIPITFPAPSLCTDNAAMVASLGYFKAVKSKPTDPRRLDVRRAVYLYVPNCVESLIVIPCKATWGGQIYCRVQCGLIFIVN